MLITKRRVRNLELYLGGIAVGTPIVIGINDINRFSEKILRMGFPANLLGDSVILPSASFGPISRFNARGKYIIHRDQPMETAYFQREWSWTQWNGEERSKIVDIPYKRYPRTLIPPPSVEMISQKIGDSMSIFYINSIRYEPENHSFILHVINLFLEIFGECNILDDALASLNIPVVQRLNWKLLPSGKMPWEKLKTDLQPLIERESSNKQVIIQDRLKKISDYSPDFVAVGQGGFNGYVVFGFAQKNLFILDCIHYGNATYVFEDNWKSLSQMTKADILNEKLQKDRLIHRNDWGNRLKLLLSNI